MMVAIMHVKRIWVPEESSIGRFYGVGVSLHVL